MKIVFFGSDDFALVHFQRLIDSEFNVCACVTQPDKAKGRGMHVIVSDIKKLALDSQVPVFQPEDLSASDFVSAMKSLEADLFVVIAYGRFLPETVLSLPRMTSINVHASLLPAYRGAAPINWAVINGETETGLSIIRMNAHMDAGDVTASLKLPIHSTDTAQSLREKMKDQGPDFLCKIIKTIKEKNGKIEGIPQDPDKVTFASKIRKDSGRIDWDQPAEKIHNLVRGLLPYPAAFTHYNDKMMKILCSQVGDQDTASIAPGTVVSVDSKSFSVATNDKALDVLSVHLEASKPMDVGSFLLGHKIAPGNRLH